MELSAIAAAAATVPDAIILDIGMPGLNGYDTATQIREQPWGTSVRLIALTGWGQEQDRHKSFAAGFDGTPREADRSSDDLAHAA